MGARRDLGGSRWDLGGTKVKPWWDQGGSTALVDTNICLFLPPVSLTWVPPLQSLSPTSAALFSANFLHPTIFLAPAALVHLLHCRASRTYCSIAVVPRNTLLHILYLSCTIARATEQRRQGFVVFALICPKIPFTVCSCATAESPH